MSLTTVVQTAGSGESRFCSTQAKREQDMADDATLANVRIKHQLAADTWIMLATRAAAHAASRVTRGETVAQPGDPDADVTTDCSSR